MRLPRDIGGEDLSKLLKKYGYQLTRQTGSHLRLTTSIHKTEHHITIPNHKPLRIGTLNGILMEIAVYLEKDKQELMEDLFS